MLLEGLKVVEMSTWVAGPGCAGVMADWGADVIKVEAPGGDAIRAFFPDTTDMPGNPIFTNENRGKKGVLLDVTKPEGRKALVAILKNADVFITNVRPGSMKRLGLDYASLKGELPKLIYCAITGYGLVGPLLQRRSGQTVGTTDERDVLVHGQICPTTRAGGHVANVFTRHPVDAAGVGQHQPDHRFQQCRLAGSIATHDRGDPAPRGFHCDVVEGKHVTAFDRELLHAHAATLDRLSPGARLRRKRSTAPVNTIAA